MAKIENGNIESFRPQRRNLNKHSQRGMGVLEAAMRKHGYVAPITVAADGEAIDGSARLETVANVFDDDVLVIHHDGKKPVIMVRDDIPNATTNEARAISAEANRIAELNLTWDAEILLADMQSGVDLSGLFDKAEIDALLAGLVEDEPVKDPGAQVDRAEELRVKWGVELGQLWEIGNHTLFCGDSTGILPVAQTAIIDPEWNNAQWLGVESYDNALVFFDNNHIGEVIRRYGEPRWLFSWDCRTTWFVPGKPLLQSKFCAWYGNGKYIQDGWRYGESSFKKGKHTNGRGNAYDYDPHEDGRMLSDIFKRAIAAEHKDTDNNHSKPLDWITALIANCTAGNVVDPYAGSGTTIIACEQLRRKCFASEILPSMAAAIIERCHIAGIQPILFQREAIQ